MLPQNPGGQTCTISEYCSSVVLGRGCNGGDSGRGWSKGDRDGVVLARERASVCHTPPYARMRARIHSWQRLLEQIHSWQRLPAMNRTNPWISAKSLCSEHRMMIEALPALPSNEVGCLCLAPGSIYYNIMKQGVDMPKLPTNANYEADNQSNIKCFI